MATPPNRNRPSPARTRPAPADRKAEDAPLPNERRRSTTKRISNPAADGGSGSTPAASASPTVARRVEIRLLAGRLELKPEIERTIIRFRLPIGIEEGAEFWLVSGLAAAAGSTEAGPWPVPLGVSALTLNGTVETLTGRALGREGWAGFAQGCRWTDGCARLNLSRDISLVEIELPGLGAEQPFSGTA
jgi:hypothetical protein